jgi:hypothetical protein
VQAAVERRLLDHCALIDSDARRATCLLLRRAFTWRGDRASSSCAGDTALASRLLDAVAVAPSPSADHVTRASPPARRPPAMRRRSRRQRVISSASRLGGLLTARDRAARSP